MTNLKKIQNEINKMFHQCKALQDELNAPNLDTGMAANELREAARHLDMSIAFIQESLDGSNED